jgi:hypothetical protein
MDGEVDRQVGRGRRPLRDTTSRSRVVDPDDDQVIRRQLILAHACRGDEQAVRVEPDRDDCPRRLR